MRLRRRTPADDDLHRRVFASTRQLEVAVLGDRGSAFVDQQLALRDAAYAGARHDVVVTGGRDAGYLVTRRTGTVLELVDLALLPEVRRHGVGTAVVAHVLAGAAADGCSVRLHVRQDNPARRLYLRAGFTVSGAAGPHLPMEWTPPCSTASPS